MEKTISLIDSLIYTLGNIEVKGENNLNSLLACIQVAKGIKANLQSAKEEPKDE